MPQPLPFTGSIHPEPDSWPALARRLAGTLAEAGITDLRRPDPFSPSAPARPLPCRATDLPALLAAPTGELLLPRGGKVSWHDTTLRWSLPDQPLHDALIALKY